MKDKKTVIEALQYMISKDCTETQFDYADEIEAAIVLLKERETKTGHWILDPDGMDWNIPAWKCSECGNIHNGLPILDCDEMNIYLYAGSRFCPNCGTRMEGRAAKWGES